MEYWWTFPIGAVIFLALGVLLPESSFSFVLLSLSLLLVATSIAIPAWEARKGGPGSPWFVQWGQWTWLAAPAFAIIGGLAFLPFSEFYNSRGETAIEKFLESLMSFGLVLFSLAVIAPSITTAVHQSMFQWGRRSPDELVLKVSRHRPNIGSRIPRVIGLVLASTGWSMMNLGIIYGFQDGGDEYVAGAVPIGALLMGLGIAVWWLSQMITTRQQVVIVEDI